MCGRNGCLQRKNQIVTNMAEATGDLRLAELQQLQREYRHMELNRRAYAEESQLILRKQQSSIEKLRKDNEVIKSEIAMIMRSSHKQVSNSQQDIINKLQDQGDRLANSIEFEKENIKTMEEQIHVMKQKVLQQRKAMGGVNASKENFHMIQKQIRILENRLDKSLMKFNEAIAHNKTLRDTIDDLRRERVVFENIYRKMERELLDKKKLMAEIIELSNQSYEQRDSYQMEVVAIEQANRKEQEEFEEQMVELGRMLENELRLPAMIRPNSRAAMINANAKSNESTSNLNATVDKNSTTINGGASNANNSALGSPNRNKSVSLNSTINDKHDILNSYERVQNFEEAFNKIRNATGITDIEELVKTFITNEDHNFSLFNYVNEQNNEIEKLDEGIAMLREEERKYAYESGEDVHAHKQILKELELKLANTESMAEKYEVRCQDLQRIIESLKRGIQSIYERLEIDVDNFNDPIVTESNMVYYLGLVEQKSNEILRNYSEIRQGLLGPNASAALSHMIASDSHGAKHSNANANASDVITSPSKVLTLTSVLGVGPKVPMGQDLLHVNPPKLDDYQSDDDDDEDEDDARPFTREEMKARTISRIQKKNTANNVSGNKNKGNSKGNKKLVGTR